eukprot:TRINITY_DN10652_c0_g1_i1.p2 TRINITY_DN10652_c0_g1~~TRINITY_DN10652_c0_g1_i1.p2  ORF type:complete len:179 (+),score=84.93 TRINITY_DN10652_c0_g1_i1:332-868(+)
MFFLVKYSRSLEQHSKSADFFYMILIGAVVMLLIAPIVHVQFLGSSLTLMIVYVWARRHPYARMNLLGMFVFSAPYLPWVLLGFSVLLGGNSGTVDLVGIAVGHIYYFLKDVYPIMTRANLLKTPHVIELLFADDAEHVDEIVVDLDNIDDGDDNDGDAAEGVAAAAAAAVEQDDDGG